MQIGRGGGRIGTICLRAGTQSGPIFPPAVEATDVGRGSIVSRGTAPRLPTPPALEFRVETERLPSIHPSGRFGGQFLASYGGIGI